MKFALCEKREAHGPFGPWGIWGIWDSLRWTRGGCEQAQNYLRGRFCSHRGVVGAGGVLCRVCAATAVRPAGLSVLTWRN